MKKMKQQQTQASSHEPSYSPPQDETHKIDLCNHLQNDNQLKNKIQFSDMPHLPTKTIDKYQSPSQSQTYSQKQLPYNVKIEQKELKNLLVSLNSIESVQKNTSQHILIILLWVRGIKKILLWFNQQLCTKTILTANK